MVEGPGTTRNGVKASTVLKERVRRVATQQTGHEEWWKKDHCLSQVIKVGKELFLIFSPCGAGGSQDVAVDCDADLAVRLHFGMNGSLHVNHLDSKPRLHYRTNTYEEPTLTIMFETKILRTYDTTISVPIISAKAPRAKFNRLSTHDVCSTTFNLQHVLDQLQSPAMQISSNSTVISDVLLDQRILPGIGNIIKVEGLHQARIHPKRMLSSLDTCELSDVIMACQRYAMKWLHTGRAPWKLVYNQTICGTCKEPTVRICRIGGTQRTTFWCGGRCQPLVPTDAEATTEQRQDTVRTTAASTDLNNGNISMSEKLQVPNRHIIHAESKPHKVCPIHGPSSITLRRCRKIGNNEQRIFYTCQAQGCNYFYWADTNFPNCKCGKRAVLRVSKTDKTGGRWFFFCAKRGVKSAGCGYFCWAEKKYLDRYGRLLTPLL